MRSLPVKKEVDISPVCHLIAKNKEVQENLEDLQKLLKSKDDELQKVLQKASEFQTRLDRLTRVLKQQDGLDNE